MLKILIYLNYLVEVKPKSIAKRLKTAVACKSVPAVMF